MIIKSFVFDQSREENSVYKTVVGALLTGGSYGCTLAPVRITGGQCLFRDVEHDIETLLRKVFVTNTTKHGVNRLVNIQEARSGQAGGLINSSQHKPR